MKLHKLDIHNIASIKDATIDFTAEPLADSDLFLITGKTGSGKTTILDAICLALYDRTPRMEKAPQMKDSFNTGNNNEKNEKNNEKNFEEKVKDVRQLMRRNSGEAFVRLSFESNNGTLCEAFWEVHRANRKPEGNMGASTRRLTVWDAEGKPTVITLKSEVKSEIEKIIGLTFDQFCRTSMLAQGDFTRFLLSNNNEKSQILEKITGTDIYTTIGKKIYEQKAAHEKALNLADSLLKGKEPLNEQQRNDLLDEIKAKDARVNTLQGQRKAADEKLKWLDDYAKMEQSLADAARKLEQRGKEAHSEVAEQQRLVVNQWDATAQVRNSQRQLNDANAQCQLLTKQLEQAHHGFDVASLSLTAQRKELEERIAERDGKQKTIDDEEPRKTLYDSSQSLLERLRAIEKMARDLAKNADDEKNQVELCKTKREAKDAADKKQKDCSQQKEQDKIHYDDLNAKLQAADIATLRQRHQQLRDRLGALQLAKSEATNWQQQLQDSQKNADSYAQISKSLDGLRPQIETAKNEVAEAEKELEKRNEMLERVKGTVDDYLRRLRASLHTGDTCPLCQQQIAHALPAEEVLDELYQQTLQQRNEQVKKVEELQEKRNGLTVSVATKENELKRLASLLESDKLKLQQRLATLQEACSKAQIAQQFENPKALLQALSEMKKSVDDEVATLKTNLEAAEKLESEVNNARKALENSQKEAEAATRAFANVDKEFTSCSMALDNLRENMKKRQDDMQSEEREAAAMVANIPCPFEVSDRIAFGKWLSQAASNYKDLVQQVQNLSSQIVSRQAELDNMQAVIDDIALLMPAWKDNTPSATTAPQQVSLDEMRRLNNNIVSLLGRLEDQKRLAKTASDDITKWLAQPDAISAERLHYLCGLLPDDVEKARGIIRQLDEAERNAAMEHKTLSQQLQESLQHKPLFNDGEQRDDIAALIARIDLDIQNLSQQIGAAQQQLQNDEKLQDEIKELKADRDKKQAVFNKWSELSELVGDAEGKKFRTIAQSYILADLMHAANYYMRLLSDRYTLKVIPGTFVINVEDSRQGFAARPVSTISGGESFLVSLALALALSDIGQNLSVDILFIDEGFGTLSGEPLQRAVDMLRSLRHHTGRRVGIISHIDELQERIPVQIRVLQEGENTHSNIQITPAP